MEERNDEYIGMYDRMERRMRGRRREAVEADAIPAHRRVQRCRGRGGFVPMRRMRDGTEPERQHEADEQRSRPRVEPSNGTEEMHAF